MYVCMYVYLNWVWIHQGIGSIKVVCMYVCMYVFSNLDGDMLCNSILESPPSDSGLLIYFLQLLLQRFFNVCSVSIVTNITSEGKI